MSVLINMEMPTSCWDCPMCHSNAEYDYAYCCVSSADTSGNKIPSDCPLIPVPKHGRLIDADALLKGCERVATKYATREYAFSQSALDNAPTVIPAEEGE